MLATKWNPWYTVSRMKQMGTTICGNTRGTRVVSQEYIWETFDSLFKTVHRQGRRVEELEARINDLERRLSEPKQSAAAQQQQAQPLGSFEEKRGERAA
jgi:tRNA(Phe) wybutosine-synthesizing methylase Tyw3